MGLSVAEVVDFLDDQEELRLPEPELWPSVDPRVDDLHPLDWRRFTAQTDGLPEFELDPESRRDIDDKLGTGAPTEEETVSTASERRPDVCAWYQPIHFHGLEWGLFIRDDCIRSIAGDIARFVQKPMAGLGWSVPAELVRAATFTLFLHEAYHHRIESLAIRLHVVEQRPRYQSYWKNVYEPLIQPGASGPLEEALANASSYLRLREAAYRRHLSPLVAAATLDYLRWRFPFDPSGYCDAVQYLTDDAFAAGQRLLISQVQESSLQPVSPIDRWQFAPNITQGLFQLERGTWIVTPRNGSTIVPTGPRYPSLPSRKVERALGKKFDYRRVHGGKGSHVKLISPSGPPIILPGNHKDLAPHVLGNVASALKFASIAKLISHLGL